MRRWAQLGLALLLLAGLCVPATLTADADVPRVFSLQPAKKVPPADLSSAPDVPLFPDLTPTGGQSSDRKKEDRLQPKSRLELIRYVNGEFARAVKPLPGGKKGYRHPAGQPLDEQALRNAVGVGGAVANPGDTVKITALEFKGKEIVVQINGGGKKKTRWQDRIQIGIGGASSSASTNDPGPPGVGGQGSTLILDYRRPLPDMTPDELKGHLAVFLDFSKQRSASVSWFETLPPEFQQAVRDKRAVVGMDREMVVAALGKPERKVRERDPDGLETEDWIYGHPPAKTIFVKFAGEKVIGVKEFPQ